MPSRYSDMQARLRAYGVTRHTLNILRAHQAYILSVLPQVVESYFGFVMARPQLAAYFSTPEVVAHVRERQLEHWSLLVRCEFGPAYAASVVAMGRAHNRIALPPKQYIEGYNLMLKTAGGALATRRATHGLGRPDISGLLAIQQAITAVMMMDMDYVIEIYEDSSNPLLF